MEEKKEKSFIIRDRRIFDETGDLRQEDEAAQGAKHPDTQEKQEGRPSLSEEPQTEREEAFPEINFINFILSLSTTAMYHFGDFPDPVSQKAKRNLSAAKQTIDILGMLKSKTEGNLDEDEKSIMDGVLFELRMRYVKEQERP